MVPLNHDVAAEVRLMLQAATDPAAEESIRRELCQLVDCGLDGCLLLLKVCLDEVLLNSTEVENSPLKHGLLSAIFRYCLDKPYFSSCFCEALMPISDTDGLLETFSNVLELSVAEKVGIGLALSDSDNPGMKLKGQQFAITQIEELCSSPNQSVSDDQIHEIVVFLHQTDGLSKHMDTFSNITSLLEVRQSPTFAPFPIKQCDVQSTNPSRHLETYFASTNDDFESLLSEIGKEISMADIITELGYGCTVDSTQCKEILSTFEPLDDVAVSKLLGAVIGTQNSLGEAHNTYATFVSAIRNNPMSESPQLTTWNTDVLVDSINELAPNTNWVHVMENLDHEGFSVPDEAAFYLLMSIYSGACKEPFPLHAVCGSMWTNTEGQISFLKHAVSAPATIFTFANCSRQLALPDFASPSPGNHAWFCLDLLEVLCQLAEVGHTVSVRSMLDDPLGRCPEILLVGLGHVNTAYNLLQFEVLSCAFPAILKDATKSNVLNHLWHINPCLTLRGFVGVHSDPSCLLRIVDVCQDMKILSAVLDSTPFAFSIRLAAAASRKDHSHLEKWLTEKLILYSDNFLEECVDFVKATMNATAYVVEGATEQPQASVTDMYWEACPPFIKVLQSYPGQVLSNQLLDELRELFTLYESKNHGSAVRDIPTSEGGSDDVEVEANAYFQHMFSGQISVDAMIQMLTRFKESLDKREQAIFNCMISNLFEEYKFFTKYPDKQLKLAAVLFGSLIKHQLVAHLGLGIALRAVLDALRKSVDSKMFIFGTTALEQFMDRVIEWPQYCNHILQISHLRGTHAEMVSAIEQALARISSSQNEPSIGNMLSAEQLVSGSSSTETMEVSEPSWQLMGTSPTQLGRTTSYPLQQKQQSVLGDRSKVSMATSQNKSILPSQPSVPLAPADSATNIKTTVPPSSLAHSTSMSTTAHATGFLRTRSTATGLPRQHSYTTGFGAALNIETLVAAAEQRDRPIETPPSEVQDKVLFMINNISTSNMEAKAKEFNEVLQEQYYPWFAQYMVMKRASIEPNFHDLYLKFFDKLNSRSLSKEMLKATYENCKVLLRSDLIKSSSEERSLLKNLGSWLGKFTIGRNQALRAKEIDPKSLIVEAYEKGLMIAVIPFTSKILEPCQSSIAYRPPNPWTMGVLSLLAEIYNLPNLKMNLKFDIEVLFKNLTVDMKDVKPTSLLKDRGREVEGNPDFSNKDVAASQTPAAVEVSSGLNPPLNHMELQPEVNNTSRAMSLPSILNQYAAPARLPPNSMVEDDKIALMMPEQFSSHTLAQVSPSQTPLASLSPSPLSLSQLLSLIPHDEIRFKINPKLGSLGSQLQFSKIMGVALDKAIKEIILPVIERSVTIASKTTKELVLKDYATESDYNAANRAARLMVGTLAGSLAHVTCKEPLRVALSSHLRSLIQNLTSNSETVEQVIHILINDNLDLGCASIESVATRKAVDSIDGEITQSFSQQRKKREAAGPAYYDSFTYAQGPYAPVPEVLHTKPESAAQQRVYEEFVHVWQSHSQNVGAAGSGSSGTAAVSSNFGVPRAYSPNPAPASSSFLTAQTASVTSAQPTELVSDELISGAAQLYSDSTAQVGTGDSSGWLGGTIAAASTSPPLTSNDLPVGGLTDLSAVMSFPATVSADNRGSILSDSLDTGDALERYRQVSQKMEALIAKDGKDGEIQSIIAEVHDILIKCVNRDEAALAVAQKVFKSLYYNTSNSGSMMWYVATLVAIRDVCKLLVKELTNWVICLDDEKKFNIEIMFSLIRSDLLNVGEYIVHLAKLIDGGRHKVATEFAMSLVQALINQDSVSISELYDVVDALSKISRRPGSPESFQQLIDIARSNANNASGFALGKDEKVVQSKDKKISANSSAVGRCSWKSSSMGMLKFSTRLQPRHYRPVTVRCTPSKKLRKAVKKLNAKLFQSNALQRYKERIELLQQELKNSTKLIIEEKSEISLIHDVQKSRPSSPSEKFDKIMSMDKVCRENDKLLKKLQKSLILNFDGTDLLSKVEDIHTQNKTTSKFASRLAGRVYDYRARMDVELSWFSHFSKIKQVFSSKFAAIISEIHDFQKSLVEMSQSIDEIAPWNHSQDYELQLCALRTVFIIWESTNISIKYAAFLLELAADCCSQSKNWRNIYSEKTVLSERFHRAELDVKQNLPQLERHISIIQPKVEDANRLYVMKLVRHLSLEICFNIVLSRMIYWGNSWPSSMCIAAARVLSLVWLWHWHEQISDTPSHIFQTVLKDSFSWRFRKFNNRNIAPSVRTQGRGECSSVATISATESLHKKKSAARFTLGDEVFQGEEFIIKLSHNQLQDIVAQIFEKKQQEGKKQASCLSRANGKKRVMSESAYNHGAAEVEDSHRYRINGFQEIKETGFDESCNILRQGNVLIGNMPITTDYFSLGPDDISHSA